MNPILLTAWLACQAFDAGSTYAALHSGNFVEANPVMSHGGMYTLKVSVNIGGLLAYRKTHAKVIPALFMGTGCAAGTWNMMQMRKGGR
jgi:hypothetical protein